MTEMYRKLFSKYPCDNMRKETQTVEFKESWRDSHLKIICSFANTDGGKLVVGEKDVLFSKKSGKATMYMLRVMKK